MHSDYRCKDDKIHDNSRRWCQTRLDCFDDMMGGEIYVKKIPSMTLPDIAEAVASDVQQEIIGIRPGEKLHEQMIGLEDAPNTFSYEGYFKILPQINGWNKV